MIEDPSRTFALPCSMFVLLSLCSCADVVAPTRGWRVAEDEPAAADRGGTRAPTPILPEEDVESRVDVEVLPPREPREREVPRADQTGVVRPLFPPHGSTVSSARPELRWSGTEGEQVTIELCNGARWCREPVVSEEASGGRRWDGWGAGGHSHWLSQALEPGVYYWVVATPDGRWSSPSSFVIPHGASEDGPGLHWGHRTEVKGDGLADIAAADVQFEAQRGRVGVVWNSRSGADDIGWFTGADEPSSWYGWSLTSADVDGDGVDEMVAGRPGSRRDGTGPWTGGVTVTPWYYRGNYDVVGPDLSGAKFGWTVRGVGDLDRDGFGDVAVAAVGEGEDPGATEPTGAVYVLYGGPTELGTRRDRLAPQAGETSQFGSAMAGPLDVNRDGYSDFLIGAPGDRRVHESGRAYIAYGGPDGAVLGDAIEPPPELRAGFGRAIAVGDADGDGRPDFVVGDDGGCVSVYFGLAEGGFMRAGGCGHLQQPSGPVNALVMADDDGDGEDALFIAYGSTEDDGAVVARATTHLRSRVVEEALLHDEETDGCLGRSLASPGDVDGDGLDDVVVSDHACSRLSGRSGVVVVTASGVETIDGEGSWGYPLIR